MERSGDDAAPATGRQLLRQNSKEYDAHQRARSLPYACDLVKLVDGRLKAERSHTLLQLRVQFLLEDVGATTRIVHVEVITAVKVTLVSLFFPS